VTPPTTPPAADPTYRPDAEVRVVNGRFVGKGIYDVADQRVTKKLKPRAKRVSFEVRVTNRGDATDQVVVLGTRRSARFAVVYLDDGKNVTAAVLNGSYRTGSLKPGESATLVVRVTKLKGATSGSKRMFKVRMTSARAPAKHDTVAAVVSAG
jgi:uncharacterized membrane protein